MNMSCVVLMREMESDDGENESKIYKKVAGASMVLTGSPSLAGHCRLLDMVMSAI